MMIDPMSANTEKASAGRNLLIYAALVGIVAIFTVLVWKDRQELENYGYPTGLGDGEIYDMEANPLDPLQPMAMIEGIGYNAKDKPFKKLDRDVVKVALDDQERYFIYQATTKVGDPGGIEEGSPLLLKLEADRYIAIQAMPE